MCDARSIAPSPLLEDLILVLLMPVGQRIALGIQPRLLFKFARCCLLQGLALILAAGHRLPVSGMIGTLQEQYLECRSVYHHQNGYRDLELQSTVENLGALWTAAELIQTSRRLAYERGYEARATAFRPPRLA